MFFELHCHSKYSRGHKLPVESISSPRDIVRQADAAGLRGVAITDHNTAVGWKEASEEAKRRGIVFIPGAEISSKEGHIIGLGLTELVPAGMPVADTVDMIRAQGGLAVAAHPFDVRNDGIGYELSKCDAIEVFNGLSIDRASNIFCEWKTKKLNIPKVGGSDSHMLETVGLVRNIIYADSLDEVLKEIKKGRVWIETKYTPMPLAVKWARQRMLWSYMNILDHAKANYSGPKRWISLKLLRKFVMSESSAWNALGRFGIGVTCMYSTAKLAKRALSAPY